MQILFPFLFRPRMVAQFSSWHDVLALESLSLFLESSSSLASDSEQTKQVLEQF